MISGKPCPTIEPRVHESVRHSLHRRTDSFGMRVQNYVYSETSQSAGTKVKPVAWGRATAHLKDGRTRSTGGMVVFSGGKPNYLLQCQFVHRECHLKSAGTEPGSSRCETEASRHSYDTTECVCVCVCARARTSIKTAMEYCTPWSIQILQTCSLVLCKPQWPPRSFTANKSTLWS
jgi:hypothetical protein